MKLLLLLLPHLLPTPTDTSLSEDELIACVSSKTTNWTAEITSDPNLPFDKLKSLNPELDFSFTKDKISVLFHRNLTVPKSFDARDKWPECTNVISRIRHQGKCLSSWAVAPASVFSDRICTGTKGSTKVHISANDIMSCCEECILYNDRPCEGGLAYLAWSYLYKYGAVTGGELDSKEGCQPYSDAFFRGEETPCSEFCENLIYGSTFSRDKYFPGFVYLVPAEEKQIQMEIFDDGPVMAVMVVYEDIMTYRRGVYEHVCGEKMGYMAVKILGWGVENEIKYWLLANSWGPEWGDSGFFKIVRGENHCNIEKEIRAGRIIGINARQEFVRSNPAFDADTTSGGKKLWDRVSLLPFYLVCLKFYGLIV